MNVKRMAAAVSAVIMAAGTVCYFSEVPETAFSASDDYYFHYDMESETSSFAGRGSVTVSASAEGYGESRALECSGRTAEWNGIQLPLDDTVVKPGEEYSVSALFKGKENAEFKITLQYGTGDDTVYDKVDTRSTAAGSWVMLSNTNYKVPSGADNMYLVFETTDSKCDFTLDEVIIAKAGTETDGPKGIKIIQQSGVRGDLDGDEKITVADIVFLKGGLISDWMTPGSKKNADVNQDRKRDAKDALYVQEYLMGTLAEFPNEYVGPTISDEEKKKYEAAFDGIKLLSSWKHEGENNPCTTQRFGADPGWMVYKDRLYLYTTNDAFEYQSNGNMQENTYNSGTINCISSEDLVNWTDHGAIPVADRNGRTQNGAAKWAGAAWAPDACWKNIDGKDKFFLYFANSGGGIGVLTADSPVGPWKDPINKALLDWSTPGNRDVCWMFDPGVYYDEESGKGYIAFGGGVEGRDKANPKTGRIVELGSDMISVKGTTTTMETPYLFEDSSLIKIGDLWYYSYCTNWQVGNGNINGATFGSGEICYMTSKNPLGPWTKDNFVGRALPSTSLVDNNGNNHHSIIYFKGKYYIAYHTRQQAIRMTKANGYKFYNTKGELANSDAVNYRSTHINEAKYDPATGKISATVDMKGTSAIDTLNPYETVQAETMQNQAGIQISGVGDTIVTDVNKGDWTKVANVKFDKGASAITAKVRSKSGGVIKVCTKQTGDAVAYIEVPAGSEMQEVEAAVFGELNGTTDLYFIFSADGIEFDSWKAE